MSVPAASPRPNTDPWGELTAQLPGVSMVMGRYLDQAAVTLRPASVKATDLALRGFARFLVEHRPDLTSVAGIDRETIEDFKLHLARSVTAAGKHLATNTIRQRLRLLKVFFDRIIEWDWPEAPRRNPIVFGDVPPRPDPLPKFLDDANAARFMQAAYQQDPFRRLCVLLLARTDAGKLQRSGESGGLFLVRNQAREIGDFLVAQRTETQ